MTAPLRQQLAARTDWHRSVALAAALDDAAYKTKLLAADLQMADSPPSVRACLATMDRIASRLRDALEG